MVASDTEICTASSPSAHRLMPALAGSGDDLPRATRHAGPGRCRRTRRARSRSRCLAADRPDPGPARWIRSAIRCQPVGPVVDRVHRRHDGQQHLRGADVGGRLLPADVLLTGLQREPERGGAVRVVGHPDQPAGELPLDLGAHRDEPRVRTAEPERHAEPLRGADRDVRADLAGRAAAGSGPAGRWRPRPWPRAGARPRSARRGRGPPRTRPGRTSSRPKKSPTGKRLDAARQVGDDDLDADRFGPGPDDRDGLRQRVGVDDEPAATSTSRCGVISVIASAAAVASSSIDALAMSRPVRSATAVWKFSSASSRPCEISG